MALTWTLIKKWLPESHHCCKVKPQADSGLPWKSLHQLAVWYIQDWQCLSVSHPLKDFQGHGYLCIHKTDKEHAGWSSCVLWCSSAFLWPWQHDQVGYRSRKKTAELSLWWQEKEWHWDKYVKLHKEQHTIMEDLADHGYNGTNNCTKVCNFPQWIKSTELEEKYSKDFDAPMSHHSQMGTKKGYNMQSIHTAKTRHQPAKPKVVVFTGKIECKKYPKTVWNPISREQQIQVRKMHEQQGIKTTTN